MRDGDTETSFDLGYPDSPLQPFDDPGTYGRSFKDKIVVVEGVDVLSDTNAHNSAGTILTGSRIVGGDGGLPWNSSLDQFLAVEQRLGDATLVPSIALAVGSKQLSARETLSFGTGGVPISKIIDPGVAFDFLFKHAIVGADPAAQARAERERRLGKSLIDFVSGDVQRLRARVGPFEVQKLDQHLDALRALEKKRQAVSLPARLHPSEPTEHLSAPRAPQRRRAVLRRHHRSPHRFARARDELRHHALRNPRDERSVVRGESARPARGQPRRHGAHLFGSPSEQRSSCRRGSRDVEAARQVQSLRVRQGRSPASAPRRVRDSRQHPRLRLERHGKPRHAQHAQRPHRSRRRHRTARSAWAAASAATTRRCRTTGSWSPSRKPSASTSSPTAFRPKLEYSSGTLPGL